MAKPRVFVSSTYFDLRTVRDDLDRFIKGHGFEPVRHEHGHIPYGAEERPENYSYREIELCEILVCIVGGRYGTHAADASGSITQKELRAAHKQGKQVYIFVDENVYHEHKFYKVNENVRGITYTSVDDPKIHEFLEEIDSLPRGNPTFPFSVSSDIMAILNEQWAGLFQRLLVENAAKAQADLLDELQRSIQTVHQLVEYLVDDKGKGVQAIQEILIANHPLFDAIRKKLNTKYRVYFTSLSELDSWISNGKSFIRAEEHDENCEDFYCWKKDINLKKNVLTQLLFVSKSLFKTNGELIVMTPAGWSDSLLRFETLNKDLFQPPEVSEYDDDIPF